jgi:hypothetical protein
MKQRVGERVGLTEIPRSPRNGGDRMVVGERPDYSAEVTQLLVRGADLEQAAVILHHVDSGAPVSPIDHEMHCAVARQGAAQRTKAGIRVGQVVKHACADDLIESLAELAYLLDREPM